MAASSFGVATLKCVVAATSPRFLGPLSVRFCHSRQVRRTAGGNPSPVFVSGAVFGRANGPQRAFLHPAPRRITTRRNRRSRQPDSPTIEERLACLPFSQLERANTSSLQRYLLESRRIHMLSGSQRDFAPQPALTRRKTRGDQWEGDG